MKCCRIESSVKQSRFRVNAVQLLFLISYKELLPNCYCLTFKSNRQATLNSEKKWCKILLDADNPSKQDYVHRLTAAEGGIKVSHKKLGVIYADLGCSKQNLFYWQSHPYSTQAKKSLGKVIRNATFLFGLSPVQSEALANTAGISLSERKNGLRDYLLLHYKGKSKILCDNAEISERMFRYYKKIVPTKEALLAIAISLGLQADEIDALLRSCGYCLSKSMICDVVVVRFVTMYPGNKNKNILLQKINMVLDRMGQPLLMTRQNKQKKSKFISVISNKSLL